MFEKKETEAGKRHFWHFGGKEPSPRFTHERNGNENGESFTLARHLRRNARKIIMYPVSLLVKSF